MQRKFKTFADALTAPPVPEAKPTPVAANDNNPTTSRAPRYRGTLPALRWLFNHDAELGKAMAAALPKVESTLSPEARDNDQEIRPTVGELMKAASDAFRVYVRNGVRYEGGGLVHEPRGADATYKSDEWIRLGSLKFNRGRLMEWGVTRKGKKLRPIDRITSDASGGQSQRSPSRYLNTNPTTSSPQRADPYQRPLSDAPALPPMLDPLDGVEANRAILAEAYACSPDVTVTKCPTVVARGASFLGGVSRSKGNTSTPAVRMWEGPEQRKGEVRTVIEEVAARGTLKSIGERLGFTGENADRKGKEALLNAARVLVAANDNEPRKKSAAA